MLDGPMTDERIRALVPQLMEVRNEIASYLGADCAAFAPETQP